MLFTLHLIYQLPQGHQPNTIHRETVEKNTWRNSEIHFKILQNTLQKQKIPPKKCHKKLRAKKHKLYKSFFIYLKIE